MLLHQNLGVDIAAKHFRVCLMVKDQDLRTKIKGQRKFDNTSSGFKSLQEWLAKKVDADVELSATMEATGVYYERLAFWLHDMGYIVHVLLPNRIKAYFKFLNLKSKTDKLEAKALAELGLDNRLPEWKPASPQMYELKRLSRERNTLMDEKTMISNRMHAERSCQQPDQRIIRRQQARIDLIEDQLEQVEQQMKELLAQDQHLSRRIEQICQIKGVAFATVLAIIAETNGFELVEHKSQLVSYAGYDVVERQSGTSVKGKTCISKKGNSHIRRALHFPAINVVKYHAEFKSLYERVFDRTKVKMKGYVAVQRKLLVLIYTLYKKDMPYDPEYYKRHLPDQKKSRQDTRPAYTG